jgi:hypothetical protein
MILPVWGLNAVFVVFGLFSLMGMLVAIFFAIETRGQVLETLSPAHTDAAPRPAEEPASA